MATALSDLIDRLLWYVEMIERADRSGGMGIDLRYHGPACRSERKLSLDLNEAIDHLRPSLNQGPPKSGFAPPDGKNAVSRLSDEDYAEIKGVLCKGCLYKIPEIRVSDIQAWVHSISGEDVRFTCRANDFRGKRGQ